VRGLKVGLVRSRNGRIWDEHDGMGSEKGGNELGLMRSLVRILW
jgi:hypothetical protein